MESQRFEELTRAMATARSRRDVIKAFVGTLFAGGAVAAQRAGALAQTACADDSACAEGEICCAGFCNAIDCCTDDADPNARCPEGTSCFEGYCDPIGAETGACSGDADCTGDGEICCAGFCRPIECCIDDPDPNARCPEGTACFEGYCDPIENLCNDDSACGEGEICCAGACRAIECCIDDADPNARCPEGTACFEGVCDPITSGGQTPPPVAQLPSTGTSPAPRGSSHIMSAILAGGAAVAAGLGLRARRGQVQEEDNENQ
jgi:hypothetical protein